MYEVVLNIEPSDLERGYNHLNHATALSFLEKARLLFLNSVGHSNESLHNKNLFLVIAKIEVKYLREIFEGPLRVTIDSSKIDGKELKMYQRAINERSKICIEATYDFRLLDGKLKRSVVFPEDLSTAITINFIDNQPQEHKF